MTFGQEGNIYSGFGVIASSIIDNFHTYILVILGLVLGFYIAETLFNVVFPNKKDV